MKEKIHYLKDDEEVIISGKLLREHKRLVIRDFLDFNEFPDSNISVRMIVNTYWLEYLLNLFFQGYVAEVQMEIWDTQIDNKKRIENWGYGIIGQEFNKKHLDLSKFVPF